MVQEASTGDNQFQEAHKEKYQRKMLIVILIASRKLILEKRDIGT